MIHKIRKLLHSTEGASLVEFALIAPVLMMVVTAIFDLGHMVYIRSTLQGALQDAGRDASLESGLDNQDAIDDYVRNQVRSVIPNATFNFSRRNYQDFNDVGEPEDFTDTNGNDQYDDDECFIDANDNGAWDSDMSMDGLGGADDVVVYDVDVSYDRLFPFWHLVGASPTGTVTGSTILRNQPFASQTERPTVQICPTP